MGDKGVLPEVDGFNALVRARHGLFLYNRNDAYIGKSLAAYGEYCEAECRVFLQLCRPGDFVIEAGANIGIHTVPIAKAVGERGRVFTFEPQRVVFQTLCANLALNSLTNVESHWVAVGDEAGEVLIPEIDYTRSGNFGGLAVDGFNKGRKVPLLALDDTLDLPQLRFIKIDVEGMEDKVLSGARQTIAAHRPYLYLENDRVEKSEALIRQVMELGYRPYWHLPRLFSPDNFFGNNENIFGRIVSVNMLCVPEELSPDLSGFQQVNDPTEHPMKHQEYRPPRR